MSGGTPALRAIIIALIVVTIGAIVAEDHLPARMATVLFGLALMAVGIERMLDPRRIAEKHAAMRLNFMAPLARSRAGPFYLRISGIFLLLLGLAIFLFAIAELLTRG